MPSYTSAEDKGGEGRENATGGRVYVRGLVPGVPVTRIRIRFAARTLYVIVARTHVSHLEMDRFGASGILSLVSKMQESAALNTTRGTHELPRMCSAALLF